MGSEEPARSPQTRVDRVARSLAAARTRNRTVVLGQRQPLRQRELARERLLIKSVPLGTAEHTAQQDAGLFHIGFRGREKRMV